MAAQPIESPADAGPTDHAREQFRREAKADPQLRGRRPVGRALGREAIQSLAKLIQAARVRSAMSGTSTPDCTVIT